jgi:hypothetical protein
LLERTERKKPTENVQAGDPDAAEYSAVLSFDNIETHDEFLVELAIIKLPGASRTTPVGGEECGASFEASLTVADCMNVNMFFKANVGACKTSAEKRYEANIKQDENSLLAVSFLICVVIV